MKNYEQIIAEEAVYQKCNNKQSSGYLADEYEAARDFPQLSQYHFRIEDADQILELNSLYQKSQPIHSGNLLPGLASPGFCQRMNELLDKLDATTQCQYSDNCLTQTHGFYTMRDDQYDDKTALEAAYSTLQTNQLTKNLDKLTISANKVRFKPRSTNSSLMQQENSQKQVEKKLEKLNISSDYQL